MDFLNYTFTDMYWIVAGDAARVYSSKVSDYVPAADPAFMAWGSDGKVPTSIDTEYNLGGVLAQHRLRPTPPGILKGYEDALAAEPALQVAFDHENRIRALEGAPPMPLGAFVQSRRGL